MPESIYYDYARNQPIDLDADGCDLVDWERLCGERRFARHPKGFKVFLLPDKLAPSDEYAESDPYSVEQNIENEFHARRMELTVGLVREGTASCEGGPRVLDLGCGQGHITERLHQAIDGAQVVGLDHSLAAIEYASERFPAIEFIVGDAYDCPFARGAFDVVVCNNLWEHVPDPLLLLERIKRTVKPGGHLVISTPSRYRTSNLVRVLLGKPVVFMSSYHVTEYSVGQVKEQLAHGGFEVVRVASKPIRTGNWKLALARAFFGAWKALVRSQHELEQTAFYLAREVGSRDGQSGPPVHGSSSPADIG